MKEVIHGRLVDPRGPSYQLTQKTTSVKMHLVNKLKVLSKEEALPAPKLHYLQRSPLQSNSRALEEL
jgi:hypothetical protein